MSQKLPTFNFKWVEDTSQFNEYFIKTMMKKVRKDIFLKLMFNIQKKYMNFIMTYHFYLKERNFKALKSLLIIYIIKMNMLSTKKFKTGIKTEKFCKKFIE